MLVLRSGLRSEGDRGHTGRAHSDVDVDLEVVQPERRGAVLLLHLQRGGVVARRVGGLAARAAQQHLLGQRVGLPVEAAAVGAVPGEGVAAGLVVRVGQVQAVHDEAALTPRVGGAGVAVELGGGRQVDERLLAPRHREGRLAAVDIGPGGGVVRVRNVVRLAVSTAAVGFELLPVEALVGREGGSDTGLGRLLLGVVGGGRRGRSGREASEGESESGDHRQREQTSTHGSKASCAE